MRPSSALRRSPSAAPLKQRWVVLHVARVGALRRSPSAAPLKHDVIGCIAHRLSSSPPITVGGSVEAAPRGKGTSRRPSPLRRSPSAAPLKHVPDRRALVLLRADSPPITVGGSVEASSSVEIRRLQSSTLRRSPSAAPLKPTGSENVTFGRPAASPPITVGGSVEAMPPTAVESIAARASPPITVGGSVEAPKSGRSCWTGITLRRSPSAAPLKRKNPHMATDSRATLRRSPSAAPLKLVHRTSTLARAHASPPITVGGSVEARAGR